MKKFNPDLFPADEIIKSISDEYGISPSEFCSSFKYHPLPEARQLYVITLLKYGARGIDVCRLTGYDPGRVAYCAGAARKRLAGSPLFETRHNVLLKIMNNL